MIFIEQNAKLKIFRNLVFEDIYNLINLPNNVHIFNVKYKYINNSNIKELPSELGNVHTLKLIIKYKRITIRIRECLFSLFRTFTKYKRITVII